ncbi:hypothetical protein [Celeribacter neptunius]|uniref:Lipoprotein n=1 Tax=Celeribacter neptunius TaxID=588602 RepID=A0A1I3JVW3_9RHOB|nr:hypothetical protein [Celeribacter neptunius]SFI64417.1 hypothetical protein SAMN04487991_0485 [Celeribacter neptunius]
MHLSFKALSPIALLALSACGDVTPDYESYKTANPYASGIHQAGDGDASLSASTPASTGPLNIIPAPYVPAPANPVTTSAPLPGPVTVSAPLLAQAAPTAATTTFNMLYETSRSGGTARVNGETVEIKRAGKATTGTVSYLVFFMGKRGAPTTIPAAQQAGLAVSLVRGMTQCQINGPAIAPGSDVLSMVSGVPEARWTVQAQCL